MPSPDTDIFISICLLAASINTVEVCWGAGTIMAQEPKPDQGAYGQKEEKEKERRKKQFAGQVFCG